MESDKPVFFLAFANEQEQGRHLRRLRTEREELERALSASGAFEVVIRDNATLDDIVAVFQRHRDQVALFHYGGHAESYGVLLHSQTGESSLVGTDLAEFLGRQLGLRFVFLNACSTSRFVEALIDAGVPAVAGTSLNVDDDVATDFAVTFYRGLATAKAISEGVTLERAFAEAESVVKAGLAQAAREADAVDELGSLSASERHVRVAYRSAEIVLGEEPESAEAWPWALSVASDDARQWSLSSAIADPLFGLPSLPNDIPIPPRPFRYLHWFEREHARVFFGRGTDIAGAYRWATSDTAPVLLLYGQSGVGKSSFLEAGLLPRLEAEHEVRYLRRDPEGGLLATLASELECESSAECVATAWRALEENEGRPVVLAIDQVEEAYTQPLEHQPNEVHGFIHALSHLFGGSETHPRGRLILGFRKEWLAEFEAQADDAGLVWTKMFLRRLDRSGIIDAIRGVSFDRELGRRYGLFVEKGLPERIADDLLDDVDASIAPTLQVLLTKMWEVASKRPDELEFSTGLYRHLKKDGLLLSDFLDEQIRWVRAVCPNWVDVGLALDVLAYHTTSLGTGKRRSLKRLTRKYSHLTEVLPPLLSALGEGHLLAEDESRPGDSSSAGYRVAHDNLAPLIRSRFDASTKPGQRLRRVLEPRASEWDRYQGSLFDEAELAAVAGGTEGMRSLSDVEVRFIAASEERVRHEGRRQVRQKAAWIGAFILMVFFAAVSWISRNDARQFRGLAESRELAALAENRLDRGDILSSSALEFGALGRAPTDEVERAAYDVLAAPVRAVSIFRDAEAAFSRAAFDPSGRLLVTTGPDSTARIWSAETGDSLAVLWGHSGPVTFAVFSPDGERIVTGGEDRTARIWSVQFGTPLADQVEHEGGVSFAAFSPDGERVVTLDRGGLPKLWCAETGVVFAALIGHQGAVLNAAFSPDGQRLVTSGSDRTARIFSATDLEGCEPSSRLHPDSTIRPPEPRTELVRIGTEHLSSVVYAEFRPDGERLVTASLDGTARVWSAETGDLLATLAHEAALSRAAFSPDGAKVVTSSEDGTARWWHLQPILELEDEGEGGTIHIRAAEAPTNRRAGRLVVVGAAGAAWVVSLFRGDTIAGPFTHTEGRIFDAALSPDGERVVTGGSDRTVRVWSVDTGEQLGITQRQGDGVYFVAFSAGGGEIVARDLRGNTKVWAPGGVPRSTSLSETGAGVVHGAFSGDGRRIVTVTRDGVARTWSADSLQLLATLQVGEGNVWTGFSPAGNRIATVGTGGVVRTWTIAGEPALAVLSGHRGRVVELGFTGARASSGLGGASNFGCSADRPPEDAILTADQAGVLRAWSSLRGGFSVAWDRQAAADPVLAFGPQGRLFAAGGAVDEVWIGCVGARDPITVLRGLQRPGAKVAFASDGGPIFTAGADGEVRAWSLDGDSVAVFEGLGGEPSSLAVSADGTRMLAVHADSARVWSVRSGESVQLVDVGSGAVLSGALTSDGDLAATGDEHGRITIWSTGDGNALRQASGHDGAVLAAVFDRQGRRLITGGDDGTVRIWSVDSGEEIAILRGHSAPVTDVRLGPEQTMIASASLDGTVRLWPYGVEVLRQQVRGRMPRGITGADLPSQLSAQEIEDLLGRR